MATTSNGTLEGDRVRLPPLLTEHADPLWSVSGDPAIWRWFTTRIASLDDLRAWIDDALREQAAGTAMPFVILEKSTGRPIGSTRFGHISLPNRRVEIGWTWIAPGWQRTAVNTEAKLLMLTHAFDVWKCERVELKTDGRNARSRAAILRIGAREEGTLRRHMLVWDGVQRDTVYFSVIAEEWPAVRARLTALLAARNPDAKS